MPRTLPWLAEKAAQKENAAKAKVKRRSSSPADLVGSDLEDLDDEPARPSRMNTKKAAYREPSSSPPPIVNAPPQKEQLQPGYAADDGWMMVEDEFYSTAQIYTRHLHQEAYVNLKKRHKARGQETLAALARATDGRTQQSRQLQLKLKAEENAKKRKQAMANDSGSEDDDDEYMLDPQLAGLMTGSQSGRVQSSSRSAQARSRRSLAEDGDESSDPLPEPEPDLSPVVEENEDEEDETDSDDLGRPARKQLVKSKATTSRSEAYASRTASSLARPPPSFPSSPPPRLPAPTRPKSENTQPRPPSPKRDRPFTSRRPSPTKAEESPSPATEVSHPAPITIKEEPGARVSSFLAKRRAQREKEQAEAKRKDIEDSIPTFLF
ncbi:hypothetical protein Slin15195_G101030 [Septoria linicola]|uniref:Uncharacterized protein n=1 Tax=Septoria linicola TaxID=215465 RepID=A0A9Q9AXC9_9PEZI|nr:hypothetical protein Slin15195_G101030 [Septoria linicola]